MQWSEGGGAKAYTGEMKGFMSLHPSDFPIMYTSAWGHAHTRNMPYDVEPIFNNFQALGQVFF